VPGSRAVDDVDGARPTEESGDLVERSRRRRQADALGLLGQSADRRSRLSARWAPRLVGASAWISSMITVCTERRVSRALEPSSRKQDSGVVTRMSAGLRAVVDAPLRRVAGTDVNTRTSRTARSERGGAVGDPDQRCTQIALDVVDQRLQRRDVEHRTPFSRREAA
jgi:hypothetical protein